MSAPMKATVGAAAATRDLWQLPEADDSSQVESILLRGADINAVNSAGTTVLMRAAHYGRAAMVKALIEYGANLNASRSDGLNALMLAAFFGHFDVVKMLVENGADVSRVTRSNTSAEMWASARAFFDIAEYLRIPRSAVNTHPQPEASPVTLFVAVDEQAATTQRSVRSEIATEIENTDVTGTEAVRAGPVQPIEERAISGVPVVRTLKEPPEIWDLVHETPPEFHPGTAFIARLTSSTTNLLLVGACVFLLSSVSFYGFLKMRAHRLFNPSSVPAVTASDSNGQPPVTHPAATGDTAKVATELAETTSTSAGDEGQNTQQQQDPLMNLPARKTSSHAGRALLTARDYEPRDRSENSIPSPLPQSAALESPRKPDAKSENKEAASPSFSSQPKKITLSPQLIAPSSTPGSKPKAKVIQWP